MAFLRPTSDDLVEFYRKLLRDGTEQVLDVLGVAKPSLALLGELERMTESRDASQMVAFVIRFCAFDDDVRHKETRAAAHRLLRREGSPLPPGKRNDPRMEELIDSIAPLLVRYGLPPATGEYSKLVGALRLIASEFGIPGDPRDALRRRQKSHRKMEAHAWRVVHEALARALRVK